MDTRINSFALADAKARFSELVGRAEAGEEIILKRHGAPVAKIVPVAPVLTAEERRYRREAYTEWVRAHGPKLGPDLTLRDLIDEGRR